MGQWEMMEQVKDHGVREEETQKEGTEEDVAENEERETSATLIIEDRNELEDKEEYTEKSEK